MTTLPTAAALMALGAITPGPNNFIVMDAALYRGRWAALRCIAGVVLGSLGLLAICSIATVFVGRALPVLNHVLSLGGAAYLIWLGLMQSTSGDRLGRSHFQKAHADIAAAAGFQFINPKAWILTITLSSTVVAQGGLGALAWLAVIVALVSSACLMVWALGGIGLAPLMNTPKRMRLFNLAMSLALVVCAAGLASEAGIG